MANVTRKDGRLQDEKGNWVWGGESYEEVLKHPDWLPLVFQNNESAEKFKKLEKIWKAEQIVKTSKNKQEVAAAKGWLKNNIRHSDGNFVYIPKNDFDFLMHHGIKGQKWGVENGPPYPLDPSKDYTAAEQKANAKAISKEYGGYAKTGIVSINDDIDDIDKYVDNIVGKYGDKPINKYFTLKSAMKYDIERQLKDKQGKYVEKQMEQYLKDNGFKKDPEYDWYGKNINDYNNKKTKQLMFNVDNSTFSNTKDISSLKDTINDISKNFEKKYDKQIRQAIADSLINDGRLPWDESKYGKIDRDKLRKNLINGMGSFGVDQPGFISIRIIGPNYLEVGYDDGGYYGNHWLTAEYDMKNNKIVNGVLIEG